MKRLLKTSRLFLCCLAMFPAAGQAHRQTTPPSIVYPDTNFSFFAGQQVNITPQLSGFAPGQGPACSASSLPPGLSIDFNSCVIFGQLLSRFAIDPNNLTTVVYSGTLGQSFALKFELRNQKIVYSDSTYSLFANQQVSIYPQLIGFQPGQSINCSASSLPPGLSLRADTCAIVGTLSNLIPSGGATVQTTVASPALAQSIPLTFQLASQGIVYPATSYQYYANQKVNLLPQLIGFQPSQLARCAATYLPPGLMIDANTCAITGVLPSRIPTTGTHVNTSVTSAVLPQPIALDFQLKNQDIVYPSQNFALYANQQVRIVPTLTGFQPGQSPNCSALALPPGMQIDALTCAITGFTSSHISGAPQNVVTTIYSAALAQPITLNFTLDNQSIVFEAQYYTFYSGQPVSLFPTLVGIQPGQALSCSSGLLPPGLKINPNTCAISGQIPLFIAPGTFSTPIYSPTLSAPLSLTFVVEKQKIQFNTTNYQLKTNQIVGIFPSLIGFLPSQGAGCSISQLPQGLALNSNTCAITGRVMSAPGLSLTASVSSPLLTQPIQLTFNIASPAPRPL